jgi:hypothetical protein
LSASSRAIPSCAFFSLAMNLALSPGGRSSGAGFSLRVLVAVKATLR